MKKINKLILSVFAVLAMAVLLKMPVHADKVYLAQLPAPTINDFNITKHYSALGEVNFGWNVYYNDVNTDLEVYKNGTLVFQTNAHSAYIGFKYAKNALYQYRIRYTFHDYKTGVDYAGLWSPFRSLAVPSFKVKGKGNTVKLTLRPIPGVTKYKVYVSKKGSSTGFKLSSTVKMGKKSKTIKLKKKLYTTKVNKDNYIKVVPYISGFGASPIFGTYTFYYRRVWR